MLKNIHTILCPRVNFYLQDCWVTAWAAIHDTAWPLFFSWMLLRKCFGKITRRAISTLISTSPRCSNRNSWNPSSSSFACALIWILRAAIKVIAARPEPAVQPIGITESNTEYDSVCAFTFSRGVHSRSGVDRISNPVRVIMNEVNSYYSDQLVVTGRSAASSLPQSQQHMLLSGSQSSAAGGPPDDSEFWNWMIR